MNYRRILIAVDALGHSAEAFVRGYELAQTFGAEYELIHAIDPPATLWPLLRPSDMVPIREAAERSANDMVLANLKAAKHRAGIEVDLEPQLSIVLGRPELAILDHIRATSPDLLVLGPHARESLLDFGHTARGILGHAEVPIWIQSGPVQPIRRILVPTDLSEHSREALEHARDLAAKLGAEVELVHTYSAPVFAYGGSLDAFSGPTYTVEGDRKVTQEAFDRWASEFNWDDVPHQIRCLDGNPVQSILEEAEKCDLIVLGTHGRTGFSRFVLGSVAYGIIAKSTKPVVAIPSPERVWQVESKADPSSQKAPTHTCA